MTTNTTSAAMVWLTWPDNATVSGPTGMIWNEL